MRFPLAFVAVLLAASSASAQDYPKTVLKNDRLSMTVYLPDAEKAFYRGARFDWSGVVGFMEVAGHKVFGPWKETHDPANFEDTVGPVEEFGTGAPLGFNEAKEGETFLKIGVGELVKTRDAMYRFSTNYKIERPGKWEVIARPADIEFRQTVSTQSGYGYRYVKRIELLAGAPAFRIQHTLTNSGAKTIDSDCYNHNFFNVDGDLIGPNYSVSFPVPLTGVQPRDRFSELTAIEQERTVTFTKPLDRGSVFATLGGLAGQKGTIAMRHKPSGLSLEATCDVPFEKVNLWGSKQTICPEPFVRIKLEPGESKSWTIDYAFRVSTP